MNRFYSADFIVPIKGEPLLEAVVETSKRGEIIKIWKSRSDLPLGADVQIFKGIIVPGFVNAHCHLELSHLFGKVPRGTGLVEFVKSIISQRNAPDEVVMEAMQKADSQMYRNGIVAVGDHANTTISKSVKQKSSLYYHTFLEVMGFDPDKAAQIMSDARSTQKKFDGLSVSITPHAPYSTSKKLMLQIRDSPQEEIPMLSYHNQECEEENVFFKKLEGPFVDFYKWLGQDISHFKAQSTNSLRTMGMAFPRDRPIQLVHNTYTSIKDAAFLARTGVHVYWCLCPNANLYIEGKLPRIRMVNHYERPVTIGTDSLASNDQLCILSEMRAYHAHFPEITLLEMLKWATWNGAEFLGITDQFGSIEVGKKPGLNLLTNAESLAFHEGIKVKRLI
ncbi:MAG TPA: amidohydrolase family protein [Sphingobacteriaceae bacterium]|nr:amidohydrolase family protein [Sphingobacteriaceae bacterium]